MKNLIIPLFFLFLVSCSHNLNQKRLPSSVFDSNVPSAVFIGGGVNIKNVKTLFEKVGELAKSRAKGFSYSTEIINNEVYVVLSCLKGKQGCSELFDNILYLNFRLLEGFEYAPLIVEVDPRSIIAGSSVAENMTRCKFLQEKENYKAPCYSLSISANNGLNFQYVNHVVKDPDDDAHVIDIRYFTYADSERDFRIFSVFAEEDGDQGIMNIK
jgi:hypothetical protein